MECSLSVRIIFSNLGGTLHSEPGRARWRITGSTRRTRSAAATASLHGCAGSARRPIPRRPSSHPRPVAAGDSGSVGFDMPFASDGERPALGLDDLKRTGMMRLFARRRDSRPSSEPRAGSARPGRLIGPDAHDGGAARGRGARSAPPHGLRQPCYGRRDRVARPGRPRRAGPATLLRSGPVPRHLRGGRHRRAGRAGARIRAQRRGDRLARPGRHAVRHRFGDEDVHRPRRPAPLPGEPGHVPPARPQRPYQ